MKNRVLMLALATLFPAAAFAQSSVDIYGTIDGGLRYQTNVDAAGHALFSTSSGNYHSNRLGFRGKEILGDGLNAHFQLESGFNDKTGALDNTNNILFNRTAMVGLGGAWGSVDLGHMYTVAFRSELFLDPFNHISPESYRRPQGPARPCRLRPGRLGCPPPRIQVRALTTMSSTPAALVA